MRRCPLELVCEVFNFGRTRWARGCDVIVSKAIARNVLLRDRVLVKRQRKDPERLSRIEADPDHYDCVPRVGFHPPRLADWVNSILKATGNGQACDDNPD
jgi:hypothetical protein